MSAIGLPRNYRFVVYNACGQTIADAAVKVYARKAKFDSGGALAFEASQATYTSSGTIATATYSVVGTVDNSTDKYLAGDFIFEVTAPATASGDVSLYLERNTDGVPTVWPDNGLGTLVAVLNFTATGTKRRGFQL